MIPGDNGLPSERITASFYICLFLLLLFVAYREICCQNARHCEGSKCIHYYLQIMVVSMKRRGWVHKPIQIFNTHNKFCM